MLLFVFLIRPSKSRDITAQAAYRRLAHLRRRMRGVIQELSVPQNLTEKMSQIALFYQVLGFYQVLF